MFVTNCTTCAGIEVEAIAVARPKFNNCTFRAGAVTTITFKAISTGQTAFCLEQCFIFIQVLDDFIEAKVAFINR